MPLNGPTCGMSLLTIIINGLSSHYQVGDTVGVKRYPDGSMHVFLNGENLGVAALDIPKVQCLPYHFHFIF